MKLDLNALKKEERVALTLRSLYEGFGYRKYKMSRFEEYSYYMDYKSFLPSDRIISFTDMDGRLLALKPDVTLSIVKNAKELKGFEKVYYVENVYKPDKATKKFKETSQIGLEAMGKVDGYTTLEVIHLAAKSLEAVEEDFVLDISHIGIVMGLLDCGELCDCDCKDSILACIVSKNLHDLRKILIKNSISEALSCKLEKLITISGTLGEALQEIACLAVNRQTKEAYKELQDIYANVKGSAYESKIKVDFSIINDINYYCGIIFQGYVRQVPRVILSGGRYDKLLQKLGKGVGAIGFALVLDELQNNYAEDKMLDADAIVLYDATADPKTLLTAIEQLSEEGLTVKAETTLPADAKYGKLYKFDSGRLQNVDV